MTTPSEAMTVILIADTDSESRASLRFMLESVGLIVIEATDQENCLVACQYFSPNLLILPQRFPHALELCEQLKSTDEYQLLRILLIAEDETVVEQFPPADDYILTPVRASILVRRIHALLAQQSLEQEVNFQREILSQMADAVVAVDANSNVLYWNAEAEHAYGISSEEIVGKPLADAYQIEGFTPEKRALIVTDAAEEGWRGEGIHVKRDGERMEVEVTVRTLRGESSPPLGHITVIRNIGERKRMEDALREEREFAEVLRDTAAALTRSLDPRGVMQLILDHLGRVVPHHAANIMMLEGDKAYIAFSHGYTPEEEAQLGSVTMQAYEYPTFRQMLVTGEACLVAETDQEPTWTDMQMLHWIKSYLGVSIRAYDHVIGFLNIDSNVPNTFTHKHAERLRVFADQAAIAIENAQLYDAIYRDAVEMRALHRATTFLYASNVFASDNLAEMCVKIADVVVNEFGKVDCGVLLIDEGSGSLLRIARAGVFQVNAMQTLYVSGPGLVPAAVRSGRTTYAQDVTGDERYVASNATTASELVVPLRTAKGIIGALDLQSAMSNAFDENDMRLLEVFAERAATAIENVQLYNKIRSYAEELEARVQERTSELNRIKERVEAILHHSSDAILLIRPNGAIQQGNRAFDMMFGYGVDEAFGQPVSLLAEPDYREALEEALARVVEKNNPERLELVAQRLNGLTFDADVTLSPVLTASQQITSVVCSLRDITQRKRLENELRSALQKEREVNELKSRFIARASHEFRTPLAVILTSSDLLRNYSTRMTPEQREEKLNRLQKEVRGLALMLDDLLTISKGEELKEFNPELIDLQSVTREVVHETADSIAGQHLVTVECQGNCTSVYADPKLVQRIIINLLSNAVKYSPANSTIQVNVTCDTLKTVLEVKDEGMGIPEEDQKRLFEAFHRAKNVEHISGTGLGLAIVKQSAELHGGEVHVASELGKGTVITVVLPNLAVKEKLP